MITSLNKTTKLKFLYYYQIALAIAAIVTFFTNLDWFLQRIGVYPTNVTVIVAFAIASIPLISSRIKYVSFPVVAWFVAYNFVAVISYSLVTSPELLVSGLALQELRNRILGAIFLLSMVLIFSSKESIVQLWARWAILAMSFLAMFNITYEFLDPSAIFTLVNESKRPCGFYGDPNKAGLALIFGIIFSTGLLPKIFRIPFILLSIIHLLMTFSRGAILCFVVVLIIMGVNHIVPRKQLFYWSLGLGTIGSSIGAGALLNPERLEKIGFLSDSQLERLQWFTKPSGSDSEDSADSRIAVAKLAWRMFTDYPFLGNGLGSTLKPQEGIEISTHNMFLLHMADYGIFGVLIMPLLVYVVTRHARGETKQIALSFAAVGLLWCFFSHTVLSDRFIVITFSLMAAMTVTSQQTQTNQMEPKS